MGDALYGCVDHYRISSPSEQFSQVHEKTSPFSFPEMVITEVVFTELEELAIEKAGSDASPVKTVKLCRIQLPKRSGKHTCGYNSALVG